MLTKRRIGRFQEVLKQLPQLISCYRALDTKFKPEELLSFCFSQPIAPKQIPFELSELCKEIASLRPKTAVEIGTFSGGTLFLLCRLSAPDATIISIDLPGAPFGGGYTWMQQMVFRKFPSRNQKLYCISGDSHSANNLAKATMALGGRKLDYLFIDGDHTYEGVKQDFEMYSPFVRVGGVVVFHDIVKHDEATNCHVDRFWHEIKKAHKHREIIAQPQQDWGGIGILYF